MIDGRVGRPNWRLVVGPILQVGNVTLLAESEERTGESRDKLGLLVGRSPARVREGLVQVDRPGEEDVQASCC